MTRTLVWPRVRPDVPRTQQSPCDSPWLAHCCLGEYACRLAPEKALPVLLKTKTRATKGSNETNDLMEIYERFPWDYNSSPIPYRIFHLACRLPLCFKLHYHRTTISKCRVTWLHYNKTQQQDQQLYDRRLSGCAHANAARQLEDQIRRPTKRQLL